MSMILEIPEQLEQKAEARALKSGESVEDLLLRLLKNSLQQEMALEARIAGLPEAIVAEIRDLARQHARLRSLAV